MATEEQYFPESVADGSNGFNEPIHLFEANGEWWIENHGTGFIGESTDEATARQQFADACGSNDFNAFR